MSLQELVNQYNQNEHKMGEVCGRCSVYFPNFFDFLLHLTKRYSLIQKKYYWGCPSSPILPADFDEKTMIYAQKIGEFY